MPVPRHLRAHFPDICMAVAQVLSQNACKSQFDAPTLTPGGSWHSSIAQMCTHLHAGWVTAVNTTRMRPWFQAWLCRRRPGRLGEVQILKVAGGGPKCSPHREGACPALSAHLHHPALQVLMIQGQDKKGHRPQACIVLNSFALSACWNFYQYFIFKNR